MHALIIGGGGFLGQRLARELLVNGGLEEGGLNRMTLLDRSFPEIKTDDDRVEYLEADFSEATTIQKALRHRPELIFHLAAIVSGEAEKNFELGMRINFHATLQLLEHCRMLQYHPRIVFASSCAVFGGNVTKTVQDETGPKPRSSYGTQKAMVELLMNDYSRRGFVDARSLRLPTIAIRPGKPNAATSSFVSGIIREPLNGKRATYPVPLATEVWIQSPKRVIQNFIHAANLEARSLGDDRMVSLPGLTTTIEAMIAALGRIAGQEITRLIAHEPDAFLERIVLTWPPRFNTERAMALGFVRDGSAEEIITSYIEEEAIKIG
ncbi:MAG: D-erythronate dehydrogenase [Flavobacteriaceae bacterium]